MLLDPDLVSNGNWRNERLDFMEAIVAPAQDLQGQIDLRGGENLHSLQFALSFRAKSRNLLPLVGNIERCLDPFDMTD